jgi:hypothetical protein
MSFLSCNQYDTPRDRLLAALAAISDDERAQAVVYALDIYLAEDPEHRLPAPFEDLRPNYRNELEKMRAERDAAIDMAKQALEKMQETLECLRSPPPAAPPDKTQADERP